MAEPAPRVRPWHVVALAVWPPFTLYAQNVDEAPFLHFLVAAVIVAGGAVLLCALLALLIRDRLKAGLITSALVVTFFSYGAVFGVLRRLSIHLATSIRHPHVMLGLGVLLVVLSVLIVRTRRDLRPVTRLANVVAVVVLVLALAPIALHVLSRSPTIADEEPDVAMSAPTAADGTPASYPDVYYLIFDRYPSQQTLELAYRFDNRAFLDALRSRGFHVADESRADYARSCLSLASTLAMDYLPDRMTQGEAIHYLQSGHRVAELLKSRGYRYVHIGGLYSGTSTCRLADVNLRLAVGMWSEFATALISMTPLVSVLFSLAPELEADSAHFQFDAVERAVASAGPKLVFAHFLLPHPPFVFDREGNRIPPAPFFEDYEARSKERFLAQLEYLNGRLLPLVDTILAGSSRPPVIILQADEGPYLRDGDSTHKRPYRLQVRTGILNTYHLPGVPHETLGNAITPVNTFRIVLSHYLGMDLPPLEDRVYTWEGIMRPIEAEPGVYVFEDVTDRLHE